MYNVLDYLEWRGDLPFSRDSFNEIDNIALCMLCYEDFSEIVGDVEDEPIEITCLKDKFLALRSEGKRLYSPVLDEPNCELLTLMCECERYRKMKFFGYEEINDEVAELQFSALSYDLGDKILFIAFRGTDDSLVGWKEDFNMSFMSSVPSQRQALRYLNRVAVQYPDYRIIVGGHSKGGNLAVYSALNTERLTRNRILAVYNNDGPGLSASKLQTEEYKELSPKITTLVPQSSIVGMMLKHDEDYTVVRSAQNGIFQHNGYSWQVQGNKFLREAGITDDAKKTRMTVKGFLNNCTKEQREEFGDTLFKMLEKNANGVMSDITANIPASFFMMVLSFRQMDASEKSSISEMISLFINEWRKSATEIGNSQTKDPKELQKEKARQTKEVGDFQRRERELKLKWKSPCTKTARVNKGKKEMQALPTKNLITKKNRISFVTKID